MHGSGCLVSPGSCAAYISLLDPTAPTPTLEKVLVLSIDVLLVEALAAGNYTLCNAPIDGLHLQLNLKPETTLMVCFERYCNACLHGIIAGKMYYNQR